MHLELGQSTVDLFHVFCSQYKFGGFDVLLKVFETPDARRTSIAGVPVTVDLGIPSGSSATRKLIYLPGPTQRSKSVRCGTVCSKIV
jgi:hypothetical protein